MAVVFLRQNDRPKTVVLPENINAIRELIIEDCHLTDRENKDESKTNHSPPLCFHTTKHRIDGSPAYAPNDFFLIPHEQKKLRGERLRPKTLF